MCSAKSLRRKSRLRRRINTISRSGKRQSQENRAGRLNGERADQAGILSAPQWLIKYLETLLTFMQEEKI